MSKPHCVTSEIHQIRKLRTLIAQNETVLFELRSTDTGARQSCRPQSNDSTVEFRHAEEVAAVQQ